MSKLLRLFVVGVFGIFSLAVNAVDNPDKLDAEGYPVMYVRGSFENSGWSCLESYKMTRSGDVYSITLPELDGQFKVSGTEWQYNYGAETLTDGCDYRVISGSESVSSVQDGGNFYASALKDVTISFEFSRSGEHCAHANIAFSVEGQPVPVVGLSGTLPVLYINVRNDDGSFNNEIIDKDLDHKNYFSGEYWLDLNGCEWMAAEGAASIASEEEPLPLEIKARGNWTRRGFAKKPFKLKLGSKQSMLGLTKSKHFAILAHADDYYGYLRNFTGFNLGKRIGLPWTPDQQPVEVVINGDYRGLYFLTESIRIEEKRINITELEDNATDPSLISGGYLVELDNYDEDNQIRLEEKSCVQSHYLDALRITWDTPESYSDIQRRFVTDQFSAMNDAVGACSDDLWRYLDLDDAARYYLVEEIVSHTESYHGSTYLFRDRGEGRKWHFSPLWDFGNAFSGPDDGFFYNNDPYGNTWIPSMRANTTFNDKVRKTWLWFMHSEYDGIVDDIDVYVSHISEAAKADYRRWDGQPVPDGGQAVCDNSDMQTRRNTVVSHLNKKIEWLKTQFGDFTTEGTSTEPERDTTEAAPLPDYAAAGVDSVTVDGSDDGSAEYFNLQGIPVTNPMRGSVYIVRRGGMVSKELVR